MEITDLIWLFFILFFLFRIFTQSKKPREEETEEHEYFTREESTTTRDEILREIQTIFSGEEREPQSADLPLPRPSASEETRTGVESADTNRYAAYTGTQFIDTTELEKTDDWDRPLLESPGLVRAREEKSDAFDFLFDFDQIRRGIIISEILQKPRSRRKLSAFLR